VNARFSGVAPSLAGDLAVHGDAAGQRLAGWPAAHGVEAICGANSLRGR
jgi:hypothetical protein